MKLDLGDGRVLQMPDEMSDESARQLKRLILVNEERAATAEAQVRALTLEVTRLRAEMAAFMAQPRDTGVVEAIGRMHKALEDGHARIVAAASADRMIVPDEYGEFNRSKVVR